MAFEVSSVDLHVWATTLSARSQLPRVLRRLVLLQAGVSRVEFAADEDTQLGGFDGTVEFSGTHPYVPDGASIWELGVNDAVKKKADSDYTKRTDEVAAAERANTTFVFVTLRRWGGKAAWVKARSAEKSWRAVRAYDASDLSTWLETAPSVAVWLSGLMGKRPIGALDFEQAWTEYAQVTEPAMSPTLVLAGRDEERDRVQAFLQGGPGVLTLQAESREEAQAFVLSAVQALEVNERERHLARGVIAVTPDAWRALSGTPAPMILVPALDERSGLMDAAARGHHVIAPLSQTDHAPPDVLKLRRPRRYPLHLALEAMGVPETRVGPLARLGRRGLLPLRRHLAVVPEIRTPSWAVPTETSFPLNAVLAGAWRDDHAGDQAALAKLVDATYPNLVRLVARWIGTADPPFRRVGQVLLVSAPEDAWNLVAGLLTSHDFDTFERVAAEVLGSVDSQVALPTQEQVADLGISVPSYSDVLRQGVADTLALMAVHAEAANLLHLGLQARADQVVEGLLGASATWHHWANLSPLLPRLAEAAPQAFLTALTRHWDTLDALIQDDQATLFSSSPHVGLLWALEILAWSSFHFSDAVRALARLAQQDPGGRMTNRPFSSLVSILSGWRPNTTASLNERFTALDEIRAQDPALGPQLLVALMPEHFATWTSTHRPLWRDWTPEQFPQASRDEFERFRAGIVTRILDDALTDPGRLTILFERIRFLAHSERAQLLDALEAATTREHPGRVAVLQRVRETLRDEAEEPSGLYEPADLERLNALAVQLTPADRVERHVWLFSPAPALPDVSRADHQTYTDAVSAARVAAVQDILAHLDVKGLERLAQAVSQSAEVGWALGASAAFPDAASENALLMRTLGHASSALDNLGRGFVVGRHGRSGQLWLDDKLSGDVRNWTPAQQASLCLVLPHGRATWNAVRGFGPETEHLYWTQVGPWGIPQDDGLEAARLFLTHHRPFAALTVVLMQRRDGVPDHTIVEVLEEVLTSPAGDRPDPDVPDGLPHLLMGLLERLNSAGQVPVERLARLEWAYLTLLPRHGPLSGALHHLLTTSPAFMVEVLSKVYVRDDGEADGLSEEEQRLAERALRLLRQWNGVPGRGENGLLDEEAFKAWVQAFLDQAQRDRLSNAAVFQLANLLARVPQSADGAWPHPAVRDLVERLGNDRLDQLFEHAIYNGRGVTTRAIDAGGAQERALAQRFHEWARVHRGAYPRSAAILDRLSRTYGDQAQDEDLTVDLEQDLFGG